MKKMAMLVSLILVVSLVLGACAKPAPASSVEESKAESSAAEESAAEESTDEEGAEEAGQESGGWTVNTSASVEIPKEAKEALDKALEGFAGVGYAPVALLGTQVVAGTNYAILCTATTVAENPVTTLSVVEVYADLEGNAEILKTAPFNLGDYWKDSSAEKKEAAGAFTLYAESKPGTLDKEDNALFEEAFADLTGAGYEPLTLLGTQVVAGQNRMYLANRTLVTAEPVTEPCIVTIYKNLENKAESVMVCDIDLAEILK